MGVHVARERIVLSVVRLADDVSGHVPCWHTDGRSMIAILPKEETSVDLARNTRRCLEGSPVQTSFSIHHGVFNDPREITFMRENPDFRWSSGFIDNAAVDR